MYRHKASETNSVTNSVVRQQFAVFSLQHCHQLSGASLTCLLSTATACESVYWNLCRLCKLPIYCLLCTGACVLSLNCSSVWVCICHLELHDLHWNSYCRVMLYLFIQLHNTANPSKVHLWLIKAVAPAKQQDFPQTGVMHPEALRISLWLSPSENPSGFRVYWIQLYI